MTDTQGLDLGPVWRGGKSILEQDCTHPTGGIPLYPAFDDAFRAGCEIVAPEDLVVTRDSNSRPGDAFYAKGQSGIKYWFGHLVRAPVVGTRFRKGDTMGVVLDHNVGGGPHVHVGINIEDVAGEGRELKHELHYTHGAPVIGEQIKEFIGTVISHGIGNIVDGIGNIVDGIEPIIDEEDDQKAQIVDAPPFVPHHLDRQADNDPHRVRWLQQILVERGWGNLAVTGIFDESTEIAVKVMQRQLGVDDDGRYGKDTALALSAFLKLAG